jgi:2-polyprenyl-3-methyl-5-hydroxy-6-metoxy-1,4-benzoquinol methylase
MNFPMTKVSYLVQSLKKCVLRRGFECPSCGDRRSTPVSRKWLVTALRRCENCQLLFRTPTTSILENEKFYQDRYHKENVGFTEMPTDESLERLLKTKFMGGDKYFSWYVPIFEALGIGRGASMLEFGCSWGYSCRQFQDAGYRVTGFEISRPQCEFARAKLGVEVRSSLSDIKGPFDLVFSSHALEHVSSVRETLDFLCAMLRPGGTLFIMTPNGSERRRQLNRSEWETSWGLVHPIMLDEKFYLGAMVGWPVALLSHHSSLERFKPISFNQPFNLLDDLTGSGLGLIARKPDAIAAAQDSRESGRPECRSG